MSDNMEGMKIVRLDSLTMTEQINLLYSIFRSTFDYKICDEPKTKTTAWKMRHLIGVFLKMHNIP